ncbi:putative transmembrane ascorbate ferrireductase 3 [Morus notabilis]|uniref:Putative transmembrane ascorbate ferrireductase 3 n=1 Tax=Morus notabilis TaxID=981085 RepID=W9S2C6_9ROSA|nr:putative transmembrane ascorbate ferrireductase 3 [Morus notabilis]
MALTTAVTAKPVSIFAHLLGIILYALFMVLGPVLAAGEGLVFGILGIYVIFKFHNEIGLWNMFTLHSWLGIITICSFGLQWLLGLFTSLFPGAEKTAKATLMPWHIYAGMVIFVLAVCSTEMGLAQAFIFLGLGRSQEALIVNFTGLFIFLFAASVGLTVFLPRGD